MSGIKGLLDEGFEKVEKGISDQIKSTAQAVKGQVAVAKSNTSDNGTNEAAMQQAITGQGSDQSTKDLVKELYAPSKQQTASNQQQGSAEGEEPSEFVKELIAEGKTPEEAMQMQSLRKKLHDEVYYTPLTQRKTHEQEVQEEEQKEEEKKMEDLKKEEEKKEKERPMAVQMAADRAERFPGASG